MASTAPLNPDRKRVAMRKERGISRRMLMEAIDTERGSTKAEILVATGMCHSTFDRVMAGLRADKLVYICARRPRIDELTSERKSGTQIIVYGLGDHEDAKPVKRINKTKVNAKWRIKYRARNRAKELAKSGKSNMFDQLRYAA